ncbi:SBBP repeat-containing protein [Leptolyngbya sp. FACHB-261]|uniref:SBBP repeat-containing protein n=1 Tax=Leptolyngbya sp. FACHB-261 TaxID=2692806 RepID=UPI001687DF28|nr:SBBP repeat-containing protein [Leptolyngbya sp. FACHB-261]MBD2103359.1 SBBP repeat-containing protein [Leptolyngbya sp. FACHB-261]
MESWPEADGLLGPQLLKPAVGEFPIGLFQGDVLFGAPLLQLGHNTFTPRNWQQVDYDQNSLANSSLGGSSPNGFGFFAGLNPVLTSVYSSNVTSYSRLNVGIGSSQFPQQNSLEIANFLLANPNWSLGQNYSQSQQEAQEFDLTPATATDPSGNVYVAGGTTSTLKTANKPDPRDAVVTKYDRQGKLLFSKQFGSERLDTILSIDTDSEGNFYVAGITEGDLAASKQAETSDAFVAKFDSNGNQLWIKQFGRNSIFQTFSIDVDTTGNAYVTGVDVKPAKDLATADFWASKFDTNGNQKWLTTLGSVNQADDESSSIAVDDQDGSVYLTGWTAGDLAKNNAGLDDAWVAKFNNRGQVQWIRQLGTADDERSLAVDTDSQGNVYVTGWTLGGLGGNNAGSYDTWLAKFDSNGNQLWIKQLGKASTDEPIEMFIDGNDSIVLSGYTSGNLSGTNVGSFDTWVARYDTQGNQVWLRQFGTSKFDRAYGITGDNTGKVYVTGVTDGSGKTAKAAPTGSWVAKLDTSSGTLRAFGGNSQGFNTAVTNSPTDTTASPELFTDLFTDPFTDQSIPGYMANLSKPVLKNLGSSGSSTNSGRPSSNLEHSNSEQSISGPLSTSVPEPSASLGLLAITTVAWISRRLGATLKKQRKART